jgi:hypothetical protein
LSVPSRIDFLKAEQQHPYEQQCDGADDDNQQQALASYRAA